MPKKIALFLITLLLLAACASQPSGSDSELTVEMTDFAYTPASITIPAGKPVTLTLNNTGNMEHDFVIEKIDATARMIEDNGSDAHHAHGEQKEYDLHVSALPGQASVVELTVSTPGTYQIICSVAGHLEAGMIAELVVTDEE